MNHIRLKAGLLGVAAATAGALPLALATGAGAAAATHSGAIQFHSVAVGNAKTTDIVTGAIVDHGSDHSDGKYEKIVLSQGTFLVYSATLNKSFKITPNQTGCYVLGVGHADNLPISHGTGVYAGITGTISVTATFSDLGVVKNGVCENLNKHSSASVDSFSGVGHVSY